MGLNDNQPQDDIKTPTLTACIAVEESGLDVRRALESVKDIADEIVLVESTKTAASSSGKKDVTPLIEMAKEYNAGYFCKDFDDDMSQFKNAAVRAAEGEFVLLIDPDEELAAEDKEKIEKLISAKHYDVFYTKVVNYDMNGDVVSFYYRPKLFRKLEGFHFEGEFIPKLVHNNKEKYTGISFKHYGYALPKEKLAIKNFINQNLFKKQIKREPENPFCYFYAAEGHELVLDFDAAKEHLLKAIDIIKATPEESPELKTLLVECYYALARIALSLEDLDEALNNAMMGYEIAKNSININFILGEVYFARKEYDSAYNHFAAYLEFKEMLEKVEIKTTFMIFDAAYYVNLMIGKTLMTAGKPDEALPYFEKSLKIKPDYAETLNELGCLYQLKGDISEAKEYFMWAGKADPDLVEAVCNLGVATFLEDPDKGLELMKKAADLKPDDVRFNQIYQNYLSNKDRILERRRISVIINPYDYSRIKETVKSVIDIADELIILNANPGLLTVEELAGKKLKSVPAEAKLGIAAKKNLMINSSKLDWIFVLNEGEILNKNDVDRVLDLTREKDVDMYFLNITSLEQDPDCLARISRYEPRLFRRSDSALFDETIFDNVNVTGESRFSEITLYKDGVYDVENITFKADATFYNNELTRMPKNFYARFMLGKLFYIAMDIEKAAAEFSLAKSCEGSVDDDNIGFFNENLYLLGCSYLALKQSDKAKVTFKEILKNDNEFLDAYYQLGYMSCFNSGDPKQGKEFFEKYFSILKNIDKVKKYTLVSCSTRDFGYKALYYYGVLCQKLEELDKAEESFKKAIKANPEYAHSYINLASIALNKDDTKSAKEYLKKAASIDDKNYATHHQLAILCIKEKDFGGAKDELSKCLDINPDNIETLSLLGRVNEELKDFDKAEEYYRMIVDRQPQDKNSILKLGDILLKKEDPQAALRVFRDLLAMNQSFVPANVSVGAVLIHMNKMDQAETHFNDLIKKYPDVAEYVLYAGKVAILKKNFGDALTFFDKLVAINPKYKTHVEEQKKILKDKGII
jgi:tetratricopeptide (TPR) repeat protein